MLVTAGCALWCSKRFTNPAFRKVAGVPAAARCNNLSDTEASSLSGKSVDKATRDVRRPQSANIPASGKPHPEQPRHYFPFAFSANSFV